MNRMIKAYKKKGLLGFILAMITYPFRHSRLYTFIYYLRKKNTLIIGGVKLSFLVSQLSDASGLRNTFRRERFVWEYIQRVLRPGDIFWDVGANIGFYSLLAAGCSDVKVIAFEPNPATVGVLKKNIEINNRSNIRVLNIALSELEGRAGFNTIKLGSTDARAHLVNEKTKGNIEVDVHRGDKLVEFGVVPKPNILKIDVEGAEYLVMKGMSGALSNCRLIICEVHSMIERYGNSMGDIETLLNDAGYHIENKIPAPAFSAYHIFASRYITDNKV